MRHNILIADDEVMIRKGLIARLEYLEIRADEIFEASSGKEALELVKTGGIDILLTDIRMPDMDGLSLIGEVKKFDERIECVVISGYAEFTYAGEAIRHGVMGYLLKPVSNGELKQTLRKVYASMEKRRTSSAMKMLENEKKELILEKEINALFATSEEKILLFDRLRELTESFPDKENRKDMKMYFCIFRVNKESYQSPYFKGKNRSLIRFSVKNVFSFSECASYKLIVNSLSDENRLYAVFAEASEKKMKDEIENIYYEMKSVLQEKMSIFITAGVSRVSEVLRGKSAEEATTALKQRLIYGNGNIYFREDISVKDHPDFPKTQVHLLKNYLERNEVEKMEALMKEIFTDDMAKKYGPSYLGMMWVQIINMIFQYYEGRSHRPAGLNELLINFKTPDKMQSIEEIRTKMTEILVDCMKTESISEISVKGRIRLALRYISEHYGEYLSINELAERYDMSPNYFSSVFKKEVGKSAINYITELRVENAKEFLITTEESVAEIAKRVGYEDGQYFFRVFKKYSGMTPLKFREEKREG